MIATKERTSPQKAYEILCVELKKRPAVQSLIMGHLRAVTGSTAPLPIYHNNFCPNCSRPDFCEKCGDERLSLYRSIVKAMMANNYSILQGQAGAADQRADPIEVAEKEAATQTTAAEPLPEPLAEEPALTPPRTNGIQNNEHDNLALLLARALKPHIGETESVLNESRVKELALEVVKQALSNGEFPEERVKGIVADSIKGLANRIEVISNGTVRGEINGVTHWQLPQILAWVDANIPVWLWGGAGGGKTHLPQQIASGLNLPWIVCSIDPTTTIGKLLGYRNLAIGEFVEGWLYKPFKEGGLVMLDEIDTGDPGILAALNALLANGSYLFPNGVTVQRHENFRVIAGANTKGCGAVAGYTARNRLDAATLDRFAVIELEYDTDLERSLASGELKQNGKAWERGTAATPAQINEWVSYVQRVRAKFGSSVLISPRLSVLGSRALRAGIKSSEVADALLFKLTVPDTKRAIIAQFGEFTI